jgi:glycosyltransferase involved in cell wall biosynthesis
MKIALLISTYNWPESLNLIFLSLKKQTLLPHEVLIADDGSQEDTKLLIDSFRDEINIPVRHIWQEDKGFRKSRILNKTLAATDADYIIQIDGDCVMHKRFIEDHVKNISENLYLYGTRVGVRYKKVGKVIAKRQTVFCSFSPMIHQYSRGFRIPFLSRFYKKERLWCSSKMRGCNMSYWRKDFIAVNGYNEDFEGWGREDSDLAIRLYNNGLYCRRLRYIGIVYHLDHDRLSAESMEKNDKMEKGALKNKIIRCDNGVDKYLQ